MSEWSRGDAKLSQLSRQSISARTLHLSSLGSRRRLKRVAGDILPGLE
jgi:hypothetical protein